MADVREVLKSYGLLPGQMPVAEAGGGDPRLSVDLSPAPAGPPASSGGRRRLFQDPKTGEKWAIPYETTPPDPAEAMAAIKTGKAQKVGEAAAPAPPPGAPAEQPQGAATEPTQPDVAAAGPAGIRPPPGPGEEKPSSMVPWLLKSGGGALGGAAGTALGSMAGGIGAVPGALAGAGLGTAGGGALSRILGYEPPPPTVGKAAIQAAQDILSGAAGEAGGRALGALGGKATPPAARMATQAFKATADKLGIPMRAGDVTMGRGIQRLENIPTYFTVGAGAVQRFATKQVAAADQAVQKLVSSMGPSTSMRVAGDSAKDATKEAIKAWRAQSEQAFDAIGNMVGNEPVVPTKNIRAALERILDQSRISPMGPPSGAQRVAGELGSGGGPDISKLPPNVRELFTVKKGATPLDLSRLPGNLQELFETDKIPYKVAREIQQQFSELGGSKGAPIGGIRQGQNKFLAREMGKDLEDFMQTQSPSLRAEDKAIRTAYQLGKIKFNTRLNTAILKDQINPEQAVRNIFDPNDIDTTMDFQSIASKPLYKKLTVAWMADMLQSSMDPHLGVQGTPTSFSPQTFVRKMEPYIRSGSLDVILEPDTAQYVKDLVNTFGRLGRAESLAKGSSGGMGGHMAVGQLHQIIRLGASPMMAAGGYSVGGVPGAAAGVAMPWALGRLTTSPKVINWLISGYGNHWPRETLRIAAHMLTQGAQELSPDAQGLESNATPSP